MQRSARRFLGVPWPDLAVASLLTIAAVVTTALDREVLHPWTEIVAMVIAGSLMLRTRAPLAMTVAAVAGIVALCLLPGASTPLWSFVTVLIMAFSITEKATGIRCIVALALLLAAAFVIQAKTSTDVVEILLTPVIIVGAPAVAGWLLSRSRQQAERLRRLTAELSAERERHAAMVAEAERARISRDLHDILAHTLSTISVQAGAAQQLLSASDPAREQVEHIMASAHDALEEVRSLLTVTRRGQADAAPRPGLDRLAELVASADSGVELVVSGTPAALPAGLSLAGFRIVQESLTNARRHAPGQPVRVTVDYGTDAVGLVIENETAGHPAAESPAEAPAVDAREIAEIGGHGLIGMAERTAAHSGALQAGRFGNLWVVRATLPYPAATGQPRQAPSAASQGAA